MRAPAIGYMVRPQTRSFAAGENPMNLNLSRQVLLALYILPLCATDGAVAQDDKWGKPLDLKVLVPPLPPIVPVPRDYQLNPGTVGGSQTPYINSPLQSPGSSVTQTTPGIRLTIPSR
jgi:hypothetical protein